MGAPNARHRCRAPIYALCAWGFEFRLAGLAWGSGWPPREGPEVNLQVPNTTARFTCTRTSLFAWSFTSTSKMPGPNSDNGDEHRVVGRGPCADAPRAMPELLADLHADAGPDAPYPLDVGERSRRSCYFRQNSGGPRGEAKAIAVGLSVDHVQGDDVVSSRSSVASGSASAATVIG